MLTYVMLRVHARVIKRRESILCTPYSYCMLANCPGFCGIVPQFVGMSDIGLFVMYYIYVSVRAIPTYRVYRLCDSSGLLSP